MRPATHLHKLYATVLFVAAAAVTANAEIKNEPVTHNLQTPVLLILNTEYAVVKNKSDIYETMKEQFRGFIADQPSQNVLKNVFAEKMKNYSDPVTFEMKLSPEETLNGFSEELKKKIINNEGKIVWLSENVRSCTAPAIDFHYNINNPSGADGILNIDAQITKNCDALRHRIELKMHFEMPFKKNQGELVLSLDKFNTLGGWKLPFGGYRTELASINVEKVISLIQDVPQTLVSPKTATMRDYNALLSSITQAVQGKLSHRYYKAENDSRLKTEKTYKVSFDVAVGRLQRSLDQYKYEKEKSTFSFDEPANINGIDLKRHIFVRLFPEMNNQVAVVVDMTYDLVVDSLTNDTYGEREARQSFDSTINHLNSLLRL